MSDSLQPHGLYVARQVPLSMGFSRQEYWSGLPFLPPGDLPDPGMEPMSPKSPKLVRRFFTTATPGKPIQHRGLPLINLSAVQDKLEVD